MEVIDLHDNGWKPMQIVRILDKRGVKVHVATIGRWVHPERAERNRVQNRRSSKRHRDEVAAARPSDPFAGMTGLSRKYAELEARLEVVEQALAGTEAT